MAFSMKRGATALLTVAAALLIALAASASGAGAPAGLQVAGNRLETLAGAPVRLLGVDRSGGEYSCVDRGSRSVFSGPSGAAAIAAIVAWHVNAIRLPVNEDCWLGIDGADPGMSGASYRAAVERFVGALRAAGLYVIVDLHWAAPGRVLATQQWPMADASHAPAFWHSVARAFKDDRGVLFDLFNEPFISSWGCWRDGCVTAFKDTAGQTVSYRTAGMQRLVNAVRSAGAQNVIMLGGLGWSSDESQWLAFEPRDPAHQLAVSFHTYNFSGCNSASCWDATIAPLADRVPVITGEFGENDCAASYADSYMAWADAHGVSYLGWTWNATSSGWTCSGGPSLIETWSGTPTAYGVGLQQHLAQLAG
jgi:hypothetical protein